MCSISHLAVLVSILEVLRSSFDESLMFVCLRSKLDLVGPQIGTAKQIQSVDGSSHTMHVTIRIPLSYLHIALYWILSVRFLLLPMDSLSSV